jgi:hypothetical protein
MRLVAHTIRLRNHKFKGLTGAAPDRSVVRPKRHKPASLEQSAIAEMKKIPGV